MGFLLAAAIALAVSLALGLLIWRVTTGDMESPHRGVVIGILALPLFVLLLFVVMCFTVGTSCIEAEIRENTLTFLEDVDVRVLRVPLREVQDVRVAVLQPRTLLFNPHLPISRMFSIGPKVALEIVTVAGTTQLFETWDEVALQSLADEIRLYLPISAPMTELPAGIR